MENKLISKYSLYFILQILLTFFILLTPREINAQQGDAAGHPIEMTQAECLKTHHGTMPRAKCYSEASDAWDKDVSKTYDELMQKADPADKKSFSASQIAWEKYRDAEYDVIAHLFGQKKGTGYISIRIIERMEIVKNRALELESRLKTINNSHAVN